MKVLAQNLLKSKAFGDSGTGGFWLRGVDLNHRPLGYEPNELPDCSTPQFDDSNRVLERQTICIVSCDMNRLN